MQQVDLGGGIRILIAIAILVFAVDNTYNMNETSNASNVTSSTANSNIK